MPSAFTRAAPAAVGIVIFAGLAASRLHFRGATRLGDVAVLVAVGVALAGLVAFADPLHLDGGADAADAERRARLTLFSALAIALGVLLLDHAALSWFHGRLFGLAGAMWPTPADLIALEREVDHRRWVVLIEPLGVAAALGLLVVARAPAGAPGMRRVGGRRLVVGAGSALAFCASLVGGEVLVDRELTRLHALVAVLESLPDVVLPDAVSGPPPEPVYPVVFVEASGAAQIARSEAAGALAPATPNLLARLLEARAADRNAVPALTFVGDGRAPFAALRDLVSHAPIASLDLRFLTHRAKDPRWPIDSVPGRLGVGESVFVVRLETPDETARRLDRDRHVLPTRMLLLLDEEGLRVGLPSPFIACVFPAKSSGDPDYPYAKVVLHLVRERLSAARSMLPHRASAARSAAGGSGLLGADTTAPVGYFYLSDTAIDANTLLKRMLDEARRLQREPVAESEPAAAKAAAVAAPAREHEPAVLATRLAQAELVGGDWKLARTLDERLNAVTAAGVLAYAKARFGRLHVVVLGDPGNLDRKLVESL
jgi:hypothetical protein